MTIPLYISTSNLTSDYQDKCSGNGSPHVDRPPYSSDTAFFFLQDQLPVFTSKVYQAAADLWEPWLIPEALKTLREGK